PSAVGCDPSSANPAGLRSNASMAPGFLPNAELTASACETAEDSRLLFAASDEKAGAFATIALTRLRLNAESNFAWVAASASNELALAASDWKKLLSARSASIALESAARLSKALA